MWRNHHVKQVIAPISILHIHSKAALKRAPPTRPWAIPQTAATESSLRRPHLYHCTGFLCVKGWTLKINILVYKASKGLRLKIHLWGARTPQRNPDYKEHLAPMWLSVLLKSRTSRMKQIWVSLLHLSSAEAVGSFKSVTVCCRFTINSIKKVPFNL